MKKTQFVERSLIERCLTDFVKENLLPNNAAGKMRLAFITEDMRADKQTQHVFCSLTTVLKYDEKAPQQALQKPADNLFWKLKSVFALKIHTMLPWSLRLRVGWWSQRCLWTHQPSWMCPGNVLASTGGAEGTCATIQLLPHHHSRGQDTSVHHNLFHQAQSFCESSHKMEGWLWSFEFLTFIPAVLALCQNMCLNVSTPIPSWFL